MDVHLVADLDEVVAELLNGVGGGTRLDGLGVVCNEDGLCGFDDDNAFSALEECQHRCTQRLHFLQIDVSPLLSFKTHLLAIDTSVIGLEHDELLAGNVQTAALDLLDI